MAILCHVKVGVDFHGSSYVGVSDRPGERGKVEVIVVFMIKVVMGNICVTQTMDVDRMGEVNCFADFLVTLQRRTFV